MATIALILSIVAFVLLFFNPIPGILCAVISLVLALKARKDGESGSLPMVAIVFDCIALVIGLIMLLIVGALLGGF